MDRYQLNETGGTMADDFVGGHNGTLSGDATFVSGGINGGDALSVNNSSSNGWVNLGTYFNPSGDFSIVAWINTTQTAGAFVVGNNQQYVDNGFGLGVNVIDPNAPNWGQTNKAAFEASQHPNSGGQAANSTTSVNDGTWHQIVGIYQASGLNEIAVDGMIQGSFGSVPYANPNNFLVIGGADNNANNPDGSFTGLIDDVQIYNGALSASQVQYLYNHPDQTLAPPTLSSPAYSASGQFQTLLNGFSNQDYTLQMSTNLGSTNWVTLYVTNNSATNSFLLTDPNATNQQRFYRVLVGP